MTAEREFWDHVARARRYPQDIPELARLYVRRDQGRRVELIAAFLRRAAAAPPSPDERHARIAVWSIVPLAWFVGAPATDPLAPQRRRPDAVESLARAAIRVARRGAGRCAEPLCCCDKQGRYVGAVLAADAAGDYCARCAQRQPRSGARSTDIEGERDLFNRAIYSVFGEQSRARARRRP